MIFINQAFSHGLTSLDLKQSAGQTLQICRTVLKPRLLYVIPVRVLNAMSGCQEVYSRYSNPIQLHNPGLYALPGGGAGPLVSRGVRYEMP